MVQQSATSESAEVLHFHPGEVAMQAAAGIDTEAFDLGVAAAFRPELSRQEIAFVERRTFSVAATVDGSGRLWASPLLGRPGGLFSVLGPVTVRIDAQPVAGDPFVANVEATGELGVLFFDPSLRRRAKSLGRGVVGDDGSITYHMHRNFGLCNKYIFKRSHEPAIDDPTLGSAAHAVGERLDDEDRTQLGEADTVFLASHHVEHGADATHRGGPAGFVTVLDDRTITIPDYVGNGMFQTLGNLLLDDRIGVMAVDVRSGRAIQLTGRAELRPPSGADPLAQSELVIAIDERRVVHPAIGTWTDHDEFAFRPGLVNPGTPYLNGRPPAEPPAFPSRLS